jgi:methyl-accepting chemotaxis protein
VIILKSVKAKLLSVVFGAIAALSIVTFVALARLHENLDSYYDLVKIDEHASTLALKANLDFKRQVQEWKNVLIRGADSEKMAKYWGSFNKLHTAVQDTVEELIAVLPDGTESESVAKQFLIDHRTMLAAYSKGRDAYIAANYNIAVGDKSVSGIDRAPSAALDSIVESLGASVQAKSASVSQSAKDNLTYSIVAFIIIIVLICVISLFVVDKIIVKPLSKVSENLAHLGQGDLSMACIYENEDEIGKIADAARLLHGFLTNNMETMRATSAALTDSSRHMQRMADELSTESSQQFSATEQVATAIQEMTHSAEEVANNSAITLDITKETAKKSTEGTQTVNSAKDKSVKLVSELNESAVVIKELAENAANVSNVLDVIRGIAEQTNLLALNAAIEAARAGEQGRGFAVVADEVRTLAQRTQDSTAEIEKILDSVKSGADNAVIAMDKGQDSSQKAEADIILASAVLQEIASMVNEITDKNVQIATASSEQTDVATGISALMTDIQSLAESTQSRVDKTKQISQELDKLVGEFDQQIARFKL